MAINEPFVNFLEIHAINQSYSIGGVSDRTFLLSPQSGGVPTVLS